MPQFVKPYQPSLNFNRYEGRHKVLAYFSADDKTIAQHAGNGNVSAGIRKALTEYAVNHGLLTREQAAIVTSGSERTRQEDDFAPDVPLNEFDPS